MNKKSMIEKIKKLLNLANSDNENEAKLAAANANKLLTKYNLSMQEVEVNRDYESTTVAEKSRMAQEDKWIFPVLRDFYFVNPIIYSRLCGYMDSGRRKRVHCIVFIGEDTNVEIASYIYEFLLKEYRILWKSYSKRTGAGKASKDSYYHGLTWGLKEQLKQAQTVAQQETGLVLVRDPGIDKFMNEQHPDLKNKKMNANCGDQEAAAQGVEDGKKIQIRKGLNNNTQSGPSIAAIAAAMCQ